MIEQSIYFALGCIVTALLALLFAPVFWRRALRLTRQRLQLQVPLSMQEILAERDQIRAMFAVERLRLEQRMERIQATKTKDLLEIGRRTMEAGALADEVAALRRLEQAQQKEIDLLMSDAVERGAEKSALTLALQESEGKIEQWRKEAESAHAASSSQQEELNLHRSTIASLKSRVSGLKPPLSDAGEAHAAGEKSLEESLRARLEAAMTQAARHETASISLRRELDDAKIHIRQLEADIAGDRKGDNAEASDGDRDLRASIHDLGVAVARLTRQARDRDEAGTGRQKVSDAPRPVGVA